MPIDIPEGPSLLINFPYAYLYGNDDGTVGALNYIKREEAVALLYRLLKQDNKTGDFSSTTANQFKNIESDRWSKVALEYMKYIGVYHTDYISARADIVRGEVAKIVCFALRLRPDENIAMNFDDITVSNPYYNYIKALSDIGILQGYDNKIEPDKEMTRAEFIAMVNRMIGRDEKYNIVNSMNPYSDLTDTDVWYYEDVMRASFGYFDDPIDGIYLVDVTRKPDRNEIDYN